MPPTSRKQAVSPKPVSTPRGRRANSADSQAAELQASSDSTVTEQRTTTLVEVLAKFEAFMNCRLDDFDTYNDYYVTFQRLVAEFEALPGCEKLGEQHKFIIFSMNLGPYFRPWINDLSTFYNIAGLGSSKPEKIGFLQFDRKIRDFGLNAARHRFWKDRIQWRSHCTYEIIDSTGFIPKWLYAHSPGRPHHIARLKGPFESTCTLPGHKRSPHTNGACRTQCPHLRAGFLPDEKDVMAVSWD